jgi:hypothetical protein
MANEKAPSPVDKAQWPEARGFRRLYSKNPEYQARFLMVLLGFRQDLVEWAYDEATTEAIDTVIRGFHARHSEFMQDGYAPDSDFGLGAYVADDRLLRYVAQILEGQEPKSLPELEA